MSGNNHIPEAWLSELGGRDASGWLGTFVEAPKKAVADLLWDSFYFGPLNLTEGDQLLAVWLDLLGDRERFAETLDEELAAWVNENWGRFERDADALAAAWSRLCSVVELSAKLPQESRLKLCAAALRDRFAERQRFLGSFSTAPAADPLGLYLAVIAEFQGGDRSLAPLWHNMCDLPDGVPFYHARYAMLGLRRLKAADPLEDGTLRAEIVLGLIHLARAFERLASENKLPDNIARDTLRRVAAQTAAAYPGSPGWAKHGVADAMELPERAQEWLLKAVPPLEAAVHHEREKVKQSHGRHRPRKTIEPNPNWRTRVDELATRLKRGDRRCLPDVNAILEEQRRYAEATGDTYNIVRTLCHFAIRVLRFDPRRALLWAEESRTWEPYDDYTWNTVRTVLLYRPEWRAEAVHFAWVAWKRFPADAVAHTGLAEALKTVGRNREAEAIYRRTIERFPRHVPARNSLANLLRNTGRRAEAEAEYRRNIESGYVNTFTFTGLAYMILDKGEAGRAEALELVARALELDPRNHYAQVLKRKLVPGGETNLDELVDEWDRLADAMFEPSVAPGPAAVKWEGAHETLHLSDVENLPPRGEQRVVPEVVREVHPAAEDRQDEESEESEEARQSEDALSLEEARPAEEAVSLEEAPPAEEAVPAGQVEEARPAEKAEPARVERAAEAARPEESETSQEAARPQPHAEHRIRQQVTVEAKRAPRRSGEDVEAVPHAESGVIAQDETEQPLEAQPPETVAGHTAAPEVEHVQDADEVGPVQAAPEAEPLQEAAIEAEPVQKAAEEVGPVQKVVPEVGPVQKVVPEVEPQQAVAHEAEAEQVIAPEAEHEQAVVREAELAQAVAAEDEAAQAVAHEAAAEAEPVAAAEGRNEPQAKESKESQATTRGHLSITLPDTLLTAALVAEAYFYRVWAKGVDDYAASVRRRKAAELLDRARRMSPQDPQVIAESAALDADQGDKSVAYRALTTQLSSHPAAASLLVLKARMDRDMAREQKRRLNDQSLNELCHFPKLLQNLSVSTALAPLFHFQRGLAALSLLDGDERRNKAAESFSRFREKLAHLAALERAQRAASRNQHGREVPRFHEWVEAQLNGRVFAGLDRPEDIVHLMDAHWEQRRPDVEEIEDVFADRVTFANVGEGQVPLR